MELVDYNVSFVHIKGRNNILADAISRLKMIDIYNNPIEDPKKKPKASKLQHITEVNISKIDTLDGNVLYDDQMWDITCKKLASQSHHSNKDTYSTVVISANCILQNHQSVHGLKHEITIVPHSDVLVILH